MGIACFERLATFYGETRMNTDTCVQWYDSFHSSTPSIKINWFDPFVRNGYQLWSNHKCLPIISINLIFHRHSNNKFSINLFISLRFSLLLRNDRNSEIFFETGRATHQGKLARVRAFRDSWMEHIG